MSDSTSLSTISMHGMAASSTLEKNSYAKRMIGERCFASFSCTTFVLYRSPWMVVLDMVHKSYLNSKWWCKDCMFKDNNCNSEVSILWVLLLWVTDIVAKTFKYVRIPKQSTLMTTSWSEAHLLKTWFLEACTPQSRHI